MKNIVKLLGCMLLLTASAGTMAQEAGTWAAKIGYAYIDPIVGSGDLSAPSIPGVKVNVDPAHTEIITGTYMFTDNWSAEFYGGVPLKHNMVAAGSIQGAGVIGTVKQLPPSLFGQYRFLQAKSMFRPYLGLGLTYVRFEDETGSGTLTALTNPGGPPTTFTVKNAWGITPQAGFTVSINTQWYLDVSINKSLVKTSTTMSTGEHIDTTLNPVVSQVSIGYRF
jgi:outer membrane protein